MEQTKSYNNAQTLKAYISLNIIMAKLNKNALNFNKFLFASYSALIFSFTPNWPKPEKTFLKQFRSAEEEELRTFCFLF